MQMLAPHIEDWGIVKNIFGTLQVKIQGQQFCQLPSPSLKVPVFKKGHKAKSELSIAKILPMVIVIVIMPLYSKIPNHNQIENIIQLTTVS